MAHAAPLACSRTCMPHMHIHARRVHCTPHAAVHTSTVRMLPCLYRASAHRVEQRAARRCQAILPPGRGTALAARAGPPHHTLQVRRAHAHAPPPPPPPGRRLCAYMRVACGELPCVLGLAAAAFCSRKIVARRWQRSCHGRTARNMRCRERRGRKVHEWGVVGSAGVEGAGGAGHSGCRRRKGCRRHSGGGGGGGDKWAEGTERARGRASGGGRRAVGAPRRLATWQ